MRDEGATWPGVRARTGQSDFWEAQIAVDLFADRRQGQRRHRIARILGQHIIGLLLERIRHRTRPNTAAAVATHLQKFGPEAIKQFFALLAKEEHG